MFLNVKRALVYMLPGERMKFYLFVSMRALVGFLDLVAILAIGLLSASIAIGVTRIDEPRGSLNLGPFSTPPIDVDAIPFIGVLVLALFVSKALISIFLTHKLAHFLARIEAKAAREITRNAFSNGVEGVKRFSRNDILYAVQSGSPSIFNTLLNSVGVLVAEGFLFLLVIFSFAALSPLAALAALAYFGAVGLLIQFFIGRQMEKTSLKIAESAVASSSGLLDLGEVIREASTLNKKEFFIDKIFQARNTSASNIATQLVLQGAPRHIIETALIVGVSAFIFAQSLNGDLASAAAIIGVFLAGGLRLTAALLPLQNAFLAIKQSLASARRAFVFLDIHQSQNSFSIPSHHNHNSDKPIGVSIRELGFSYDSDNESALTDVSIDIPAGSQVAFIGPSGAGKSTLADLILGLLPPSKGEVLLGGESVELWNAASPGLLGYVPQRPGMISGSIAENIALGVHPSEIDHNRLDKAIRDAHLKEIVEALPRGVDTDLGMSKDGLSGGQLQRIGLARALYGQPKLLVMDEATSALDAQSEHEINKALNEMRGQVTVILIAHRLNTVQRSDIVFLVESGKVTASGTFAELVKSNATVKNLANLMSLDS